MSTLPIFSQWRPHPWHGLSPGPEPPQRVDAYIEITPFDTVKYEIDKGTGYLRVDRPQLYSSQPPSLYGFVPRTFCGTRVAALCPGALDGDHDPLDICVFSERPIGRPEIVLTARVVGGIRTVDRGEADDKIVAVLDNDPFWSAVHDLTDLPPVLVGRLRHYFATYKLEPTGANRVEIRELYGREPAWQVVTAALADYQELAASGAFPG